MFFYAFILLPHSHTPTQNPFISSLIGSITSFPKFPLSIYSPQNSQSLNTLSLFSSKSQSSLSLTNHGLKRRHCFDIGYDGIGSDANMHVGDKPRKLPQWLRFRNCFFGFSGSYTIHRFSFI